MKTFLTQAAFLAAIVSGGCASAPAGEARNFELRNAFSVDVPAGSGQVRAWFALPDDGDASQKVHDLAVVATGPGGEKLPTTIARGADGNRYLYLDYRGAPGKIEVVTEFGLSRWVESRSVDPAKTRPLTAAERASMAAYLQPSKNVTATMEIAGLAKQSVGAETNPVRQARLLYDTVLNKLTYWVKFPDRLKASAVGSSEYAMANGCGNCTDFHSLYCAMAHSVGLPARMVYGSFLKSPLDGKDEDQSYHCWVEFWAPEIGWIPLDVAVADIYVDDFVFSEANARKVELTTADGYRGPDAAIVDFYFGNLEARRVTWNRGRDLVLAPANASGPVNALPKAYVEVDGKEYAGWTRKLTFRETGGK